MGDKDILVFGWFCTARCCQSNSQQTNKQNLPVPPPFQRNPNTHDVTLYALVTRNYPRGNSLFTLEILSTTQLLHQPFLSINTRMPLTRSKLHSTSSTQTSFNTQRLSHRNVSLRPNSQRADGDDGAHLGLPFSIRRPGRRPRRKNQQRRPPSLLHRLLQLRR